MGGSVDGIMHELERPLNELQISCVCRQMCCALAFIHGRNVIHRDVKAGNILLNAEGVAKLGNLHFSCGKKCILVHANSSMPAI